MSWLKAQQKGEEKNWKNRTSNISCTCISREYCICDFRKPCELVPWYRGDGHS